jgi:hypothetical protein
MIINTPKKASRPRDILAINSGVYEPGLIVIVIKAEDDVEARVTMTAEEARDLANSLLSHADRSDDAVTFRNELRLRMKSGE